MKYATTGLHCSTDSEVGCMLFGIQGISSKTFGRPGNVPVSVASGLVVAVFVKVRMYWKCIETWFWLLLQGFDCDQIRCLTASCFVEASVYERFVGKTLQELNAMAGIFRSYTRAKSREVVPPGSFIAVDQILHLLVFKHNTAQHPLFFEDHFGCANPSFLVWDLYLSLFFKYFIHSYHPLYCWSIPSQVHSLAWCSILLGWCRLAWTTEHHLDFCRYSRLCCLNMLA